MADFDFKTFLETSAPEQLDEFARRVMDEFGITQEEIDAVPDETVH